MERHTLDTPITWRLATFLLAPAVLTGCLGGDAPPDPSTEEPPSAPQDAMGILVAANDSATPAGPLKETPFSVTAKNYLGVCAFAGPVGECPDLLKGENQRVPLEAPGHIERLTVNVTWTAMSPLTETFYAYLYLDTGDGPRWQENFSVGGTSPLVVDWDLSAFPEGSVLGFGAYTEDYRAVGPAGVAWGFPQEYQMEGVIHSR